MNKKCFYIFLVLLSVILLLISLLLHLNKTLEDFYNNILISLSTSIIAGAITAGLIDHIIEKHKKEYKNKEKRDFFDLLSSFSINMCYLFVSYKYKNLKNVKLNWNDSIYKEFIDKCRIFMDFRKPGKLKLNVAKMYKKMLNDFSFYLIEIKTLINNEVIKNSSLHHIDSYLFKLTTISQEIERLYNINNEDFVAEEIANIIEEIYEIDLIKIFFDKTLKENKRNIILLLTVDSE